MWYKDHLGNVRLSYSWNAAINKLEILDRNDYYPFGMNFVAAGAGAVYDPKGSPLNYKFGTKELQETGFYDFGARMLMPDVGRWFSVDPLAEKNTRLTPYHYAVNNPIRNIDPDGRMDINFTGEAAKEVFMQLRDAQDERNMRNTQRPPDDGHWVGSNGQLLYDDGIDDGKLYYAENDNIKNAVLVAENGTIRDEYAYKDMMIAIANNVGLPLNSDNFILDIDRGKSGSYAFETQYVSPTFHPTDRSLVKMTRGLNPFTLNATISQNDVEANKTYYNLKNTMEHEKRHYDKVSALPTDPSKVNCEMTVSYGVRSETSAVNYQKSTLTWPKTTDAYKKQVNNYVKNRFFGH